MTAIPFRLLPAWRYGESTPWGNDALRRIYGRNIPDPRSGEALEMSVIPGLESTDENGVSLATSIERDPVAMLGDGAGKPFPLLLKLLSAGTDLSVQVHPDDAYALENEHQLGKQKPGSFCTPRRGPPFSTAFRRALPKKPLRKRCRAARISNP